MSVKVVFIGGGSFNWTPHLAADLFLRKGLKDSTLILVDIDNEAAELLQAYCSMIAEKIDTGWEVGISSLESALKGADSVCVSISTGGLEAMSQDYHIPEEYGIYHCVGDTVGPGGIMRSLRNIPVFLDIARKMEKHCPNAPMIHVTNPLSQITRAVCRETSIKSVGLCHNYAGTVSFLASYFDAEVEDVDAVSVGVNHYTWLKDITCCGKPVENRLSLQQYLHWEVKQQGVLRTDTTDDEIEDALGGGKMNYYLNFELFEKFGVFPVGNSCHLAENLPYYCNSLKALQKHRIRRKGVLPMRSNLKEKRKREIIDVVEGKEALPDFQSSREGLAGIVESLNVPGPSRQIVAIPNKGQVSNLQEDVIVETWAEVDRAGIHPIVSGPVPSPLLGYMQTIVDEQEMTVEAAVSGEFKLVAEAMAVSPMVQNKDVVEDMAEKMIENQIALLPQFQRTRKKRK